MMPEFARPLADADGSGAEELTRELVGRARALRERLRDDQAAAEERGATSAEMNDEFLRGGFYHILHPRRYGGLELPLESFFRVSIEISRGDPGVGWMYTLGAGHVLNVASRLEEPGQEALLAGGSPFIAPFRSAQTGVGRRVPGGYALSGRWDYLSGIPFATHAILAFRPDDLAGDPESVLMGIVERERITVLDNWGGGQTLGMQASGSNSATAENAFVPEHLVFRFDRPAEVLPAHGSPGYRLHGDPMYLGRELGFFWAELAATQVGAAFAALDEFERLMTTKRSAFPPGEWGGRPRLDTPEYHLWYGRIRARAESARTLLLGAIRDLEESAREWARTGEGYTLEEDVSVRAQTIVAARIAGDAVDIAFRGAGSQVVARGQKLQKYKRDVDTYTTHMNAQADSLDASASHLHFGGQLTW